jgi:cell division protein FtsL
VIKRARLFFFVALLLALLILLANFPLRALVEGRSAVRADTTQLVALQAENRALTSQVRDLHDSATVGRIAHEEYGLVTPGQRSVVVLPGAGGSSASAPDPLSDNPIPLSDLLPSDAILGPSARLAQPPVHEPGFWHRVIATLEFWHSLF